MKILLSLSTSLLLLLCFHFQAASQSLWNITYDSLYVTPTGNSMQGIQSSDGNFVVVGGASYPTGGPHGFVTKVDTAGQTMWYKEYAPISSFLCVIETSDGGLLAGGNITTGYPYNFALVKMDGNGTVQWLRRIQTLVTAGIESLLEVSDGYVFNNGYTTKVSLMGDSTLWRAQHLNTPSLPFDVAPAPGGFVVCGVANNGNPSGGLNIGVARLDSNGNVLWNKSLGESDSDFGQACATTADNGVLVTGWTRSFLAGGAISSYLTKLDSTGTELWTRSYPGLNHDLLVEANGDVVMAGSAGSDFRLLKTDAAGNVLWSKTYGPGFARSLVKRMDGGYFLSGFRGNYQMALVKTDSVGNSDCSLADTVAAGNVSWQSSDIVHATYGGSPPILDSLLGTPLVRNATSCLPSLGVLPASAPIPSVRVFPNPISPNQILHLDLEGLTAQQFSLALHNLQGQKLWEDRVYFPGGSQSIHLQLPPLPSGSYFLQISSPDHLFHQRISILGQ